MKIHVLSDLHIEFASFKPPQTDADIVVLAGDIHLGLRGLEWAKQSFPDKRVVYVLGNHEYYSNAIPKLINQLREQAAKTHIHILENDCLEIDGFKFLGCTLWTDFRLLGQPPIAAYHAQQLMTDYKRIRVSPKFSKLRPNQTALFHSRSVKWLFDSLDGSSQQKTVVITHHAPSIQSIPLSNRLNSLCAAYASPLDNFVINSGVNLWIHGHVHHTLDYKLGQTRIVCNPRGYPDEMLFSFNSKLVVEL